ncbi:hypothetical protein K7432_010476 [Basidiobolus ranarum]|uniref:Uncharacterized protein n=1 Tax=Basidiobolus ranarum TaxID=34480 RepID=A0ABR2VVD2_9FUNG
MKSSLDCNIDPFFTLTKEFFKVISYHVVGGANTTSGRNNREINALEFRTSATAIRRQFENNVSVGNFNVRDAVPQECKLFSRVDAEQSVERLIEENLRRIEENFDNIPVLLDCAKNILHFCEDDESNELLEALSDKHDTLNKDIQEAEEKLSWIQPEDETNRGMNLDVSDLNKQIEGEQQDLDTLKKIFNNRKEQKESLESSIEEKKKASNAIKQLADELEEMTIEENNELNLIEELKLELERKQLQLEQLVEEEKVMQPKQVVKKSGLCYTLESQFEELQKLVIGSKSSNGSESVEPSMNETLQTLTDIINKCESAEMNKMTTDVLNNIQDRLIFLIANFQENDNNLVCSMPPTPQTQTAAIVLRTIKENNGEISSNLLKEKVAAEGIPQGQVLQCIYMLVANSLIEIDRTTKENPVRLK